MPYLFSAIPCLFNARLIFSIALQTKSMQFLFNAMIRSSFSALCRTIPFPFTAGHIHSVPLQFMLIGSYPLQYSANFALPFQYPSLRCRSIPLLNFPILFHVISVPSYAFASHLEATPCRFSYRCRRLFRRWHQFRSKGNVLFRCCAIGQIRNIFHNQAIHEQGLRLLR